MLEWEGITIEALELPCSLLKFENDILKMIVNSVPLNIILETIARKRKEIVPGNSLSMSTSPNYPIVTLKEAEVVNLLEQLVSLARTRIEFENRMEFLAYQDPLTRLFNRKYFTERFAAMLDNPPAPSTKIGLIFIGLDHFKWVNDSLGHDAGDKIIVQVAERINICVGKIGMVSRLGGDEFTLIINKVKSVEEMDEIANKLIQEFNQPILLNDLEVRVTISIGISIYPDHGTTISALMKQADKAMYYAKSKGRNSYAIYEPSYAEGDQYRFLFTYQFDRALESNQFYLEYQPKIDLHNGEIRSVEALVRWNHPEQGIVSPSTFIPLAEETGFIVMLGEWVLREVCRQMSEWLKSGLKVRVAINVSSRQFMHSSFLYRVKEILHESNIDPSSIEMEITESGLLPDEKYISDALMILKEMGVYISIDDFGTGYSSLQYLKQFNIDALKIDKSFIEDLPHDVTLTRTIISLARKLKLQVIAEGVETHEQHEWLIHSGCHQAQGYLYSKPLSASNIGHLLKD